MRIAAIVRPDGAYSATTTPVKLVQDLGVGHDFTRWWRQAAMEPLKRPPRWFAPLRGAELLVNAAAPRI